MSPELVKEFGACLMYSDRILLTDLEESTSDTRSALESTRPRDLEDSLDR